jgi:hypothetical protein
MSDLFSSLLLSICQFSIGHCIVCPSGYDICLPYWPLYCHSLSRVVVPATLHSISVNAHFTRILYRHILYYTRYIGGWNIVKFIVFASFYIEILDKSKKNNNSVK